MPLKASAQRVQDALARAGFPYAVHELPGSARTAAEAAAAVGCSVAQIAKSLVFRLTESGQPLLVIASGGGRVDEAVVGAAVGEAPVMGDAAFVRDATGFAIGGVAPIGHPRPIRTLVDADLLAFDTIWAAAGHPRAVFQLTPADLVAMTGGRVLPVH